ncbi:MAG: bacteriophage abortive infection AbiH family protein, partial [Odoribacter sp.]|nr:bacteriophage abortive infection AbiH family protein [Odoribacter sp.]
MNRIILIGNGFDLAHGLPTKYEDFIKWYYSEWFYKLENSDRSIESDGLCTFTLDSNSSSWHHELTKWARVNQGKYFAEGIRDLQDTGKCKRSSFLDEICKVVETKNWVDIENEYYKFLRSFLGNAPLYTNPNILNNELNSIKLKLIEYLVSIQD